jgi:hypothetical protein
MYICEYSNLRLACQKKSTFEKIHKHIDIEIVKREMID